MKVLVYGDRNWTDREAIRYWLSRLQTWGYDTVIEGEARGADTLAREEAEKLGFKVLKFPADWGRYGLGAGYIRNREMLDQLPHLVLAFHRNISKSKDTKDIVKEAKSRGINTLLVGDSEGNDARWA